MRRLAADDLLSHTSRITVGGLSASYGATRVLDGIDLDVAEGSVTVLLGPSGCGKTTLLRVIAGLERSDGGSVRIGDRLLEAPGVAVPPEKRRVGMVFQDWALFPHLSVARNVGYGLPRAQRTPERIAEALDLVDLGGLGDRMPGTLSGGQQQRVALARALAPRPDVMLLDEPFSNLDAALRVQVREEVRRLLVDVGITTVFVTHDQPEAFLLGDRIAVMRDGRIVQEGTPTELYYRPVDPWVATFLGDANVVPATADGTSADTPLGPVPLAEAWSGPVSVLLRPEELVLAGDGDIVVEGVEFYGHDTVYRLGLPGAGALRARAGAVPRFRAGDRVSVRYSGEPTVAYPSEPA